VHPGGRTILDAVQRAFDLPEEALATSRDVLRRYGNMSSATVMFVLESFLRSTTKAATGCAMAFGPGLVAETMLFRALGNPWQHEAATASDAELGHTHELAAS